MDPDRPAPSTPTPSPEPVAVLDEALSTEFALDRELGRGGMGVVYLARDLRLGRPVAMKLLLNEATVSSEQRERLLREARMAAGLSHPHIVPVYRIVEGAQLCVVSAFIDGDTLAARIRDRGSLEPREAARVLREIAWALGYAHGRGIVHRDVKPENILLERGSGRAMLSDFGIARQVEATALTATGTILGSVHYMSPELAAGDALDGRSDLYALGVTGYYAVTGSLPFDGPTVASILVKHATTAPRPVRELNDSVPVTLAAAIERCLTKSPAERFSSAEEFAEAIAPAVGQRLEIPPLVRGWIARGELTLPVLVMWMLPVVLAPARELALMAPDASSGPALLRLTAVVAGAGPALAVAFLVRLWDLRSLVRAGFTLQDVRFGAMAYALQRSEELADQRQRSSSGGGVVRAVAVGLASLVGVGFLFALPSAGVSSVLGVLGGLLTAMLALMYVAVASGWWNRVRRLRAAMWSGPVGEFLFRLASRTVRRSAR